MEVSYQVTKLPDITKEEILSTLKMIVTSWLPNGYLVS